MFSYVFINVQIPVEGYEFWSEVHCFKRRPEQVGK
jgi:hypothetical protein